MVAPSPEEVRKTQKEPLTRKGDDRMDHRLLLFLLLLWILGGSGYGLFRMSRHAGLPRPWLAFFPLARVWHVSRLAERSYRFRHPGKPRDFLARNLLSFLPLLLLPLLCIFPDVVDALDAFWGVTLVVVLMCWFPFSAFRSYEWLLKDYAPQSQLFYTSFVFIIPYRLFRERDTVPASVYGSIPKDRPLPKYDKNHQWEKAPAQKKTRKPKKKG